MENVKDQTQYCTDKAKSFLMCWTCQQKIHFDTNRKGRKLILLNEERSTPDCLNQQCHSMTSASSKIGNDTVAIQFEIAEKLLQGQKELKLKLRTGIEQMSMRISSLQAEL